jgi:hypothetical protein
MESTRFSWRGGCLIAQGADWRFFNELKRELKA